MWPANVFLILSMAVFALTVIGAILLGKYNKHRNLIDSASYRLSISPFHVIIGGVFIAGVLILYPATKLELEMAGDGEYFITLMISMKNTLQLFTIDSDYGLVDAYLVNLPHDVTYYVYHVYASVLHIFAPFLTAGIVLSLFKNAKAILRYYVLSLPSDIYVISELNDRSIALAENIVLTTKAAGERALVVFTDVFEQKEDEENYELIVRARTIGCILFAKDITQVRLRPMFGPGVKRKVYFIGVNEDENIKQSLNVISACRKTKTYNTENTEFYVFSRSAESEALLNSIDNGNMKVRRIDENRNFVLRMLKDYPIFFDALPAPEGKTDKQLNIMLVGGLGMIGTELVKALSWIGQMYGYELSLHIFDGECDIEKRLRGTAPELIDNNFVVTSRPKRDDESYTDYYRDAATVSPRIDGEPYYKFYYYDGINVKTQEFLDIVAGIGDVSTVYVTLGDDELNIETAMRLRMCFERESIEHDGHVPSIFSVVYSEIKNQIITGHNGLRTIKDEDYGITLVGSLKSSYTLDALEQRSIEKAGLECHLKWSSSDESKKKDIDSYSKYEYYRRSSMAEALHAFLRGKIGLVPGKGSKELDAEIYKHEHCRWSAFIRSEGYVRSDKKKSDLAKTHKSLRPYAELSDSVRLLDQIVITEIMETDIPEDNT